MGGGVEAQCFIKIGKNKEIKYVVLKIKLSERWVHCVYLNLYKSKYSAMNIQFPYLNLKNFHRHVQNNVKNCVRYTHKKGGWWGRNIRSSYSLYLYIEKKWSWVCLPGSETMGTGMGTGTSPACQEVTGTGPRPYPWVRIQTFVSG